MKQSVTNLLNCILQSVRVINEISMNSVYLSDIKSNEGFREKTREIKALYEGMQEEDKNQFYIVINTEFQTEASIYIYLLSIMLTALHEPEILNRIIQKVCEEQLELYLGVSLEYQLTVEINKYYSLEKLYPARRRLHSLHSEQFIKEIEPPTVYIPYQRRNPNRIIVLAEQILGLNHAPTKIILEQCYAMQKELGMEVLLISCPIEILNNNPPYWFDLCTENYYDELNGNNILTYKEEKVFFNVRELNGGFGICYRDTVICGRQIPFGRDNAEQLRNLLFGIYEYNPLFVYDTGCIHSLADACGAFTTVVSGAMNYGLPVSNSQVLVSLTKKDALSVPGSDFSMLEDYGQFVIREAFHFPLDKPQYKAERHQFQLSGEDFLVAIVGNRLSTELTDEFKIVLQQICLLDKRVKLLIIGTYSEYLNYFTEPVFQDRIYYMGYQRELTEIIGMADLFLNPPRNGGGTSALIALYAGVPVVTLPDGDVAGNVGKDFICRDRQEMISTIKRYLTDKEFYQKQKEIGLEYTNKVADFGAYMRKLIDDVKEAIKLTEKV